MSYSREKSQPIFDRALNVLVKGVSSNFRYLGDNETPVIVKGKGASVWDADNNEFIDYRLGWGPIILGHADDRVNSAVAEAIQNGTTFAATTSLEVETAELVKKWYRAWKSYVSQIPEQKQLCTHLGPLEVIRIKKNLSNLKGNTMVLTITFYSVQHLHQLAPWVPEDLQSLYKLVPEFRIKSGTMFIACPLMILM